MNSRIPALVVLLLSLSPGQAQSVSNEVAARAACSACHLFPDPSLLERRIWNDEVFPKMRMYMGLDKVDPSSGPDAPLLYQRGFFPAAPMINEGTWSKVTNYFLSTAPGPTNTPSRNELIPIGLKGFRAKAGRHRRTPPLTTMVRIDREEGGVFFADANEQTLELVTPTGDLLGSARVGNIVTSMQKVPEGYLLGAIGHFFPREERRGQVLLLKKTQAGFERVELFSNLPRVAHLEPGDFNCDGKTDFALSMFGFMTGRFSWYENKGDGKYAEHQLFNKPGAVRSVAHDFDKDGSLDIAALFGQDTDGMLLFMNNGKGKFKQVDAFRRPPSFGHDYFEIADFDGDGEMEFLVANGDNGDYESPPKPYHGVRIYRKQGGKYEEAFFYAQHGAFKAVARDFDEDGDMDIASVSYFPDYQSSPRESFVYLENKGGMKFEASTFRECISGRWITMDAGDIDGDGDIDMVLGSNIRMPSGVPEFLKDLWEKNSPSVLFLMNERRQPAGGPVAPKEN